MCRATYADKLEPVAHPTISLLDALINYRHVYVTNWQMSLLAVCMCNINCVPVYGHFCFHFVYSIGSYLLRNVHCASVLPETSKGKAGTLWVKAGTEGGLLSDIREVQCLICSLLHQMFIADPNIAKLVHFQVMSSVITDSNRGGKPLLGLHLKGFNFLF